MSHYEKAWQAVMNRIGAAARTAGRPPSDIRLLAVSKTFPADAVRAVHACGQRAFGENYVREAAAKRDALADLDIEWRLIGPLQSNKAAAAARLFDAVESVGDLRTAQRLSAARAAAGPDAGPRGPLRVLVQVNISDEASKSGVRPDGAMALARAIAGLPALALQGFMGIAAPDVGADLQRAQFRALRQCLDDARADGLDVGTLSMGMSSDLELAIAEGSTEVRVGSAIFGARTPQAGAADSGGQHG